uniref:Uncharacterized protein n=1 Tax=Glossina palpalis gambiensis TaxID=67801 RepID=A0A1B0BT81_9MUSC
MSDSTLYHHYKTLMPKASLASLWLAFNIALLLQEPSKHIATVQAAVQLNETLKCTDANEVLEPNYPTRYNILNNKCLPHAY